jgi:periplasmic protein TonB
VSRATMAVLYGVSIALHASLGAGVSNIEPQKEPERIAVRMVEVKKPEKKAEVEEPPPPPPPPPPPATPTPPKKEARPKQAEAAPPPAAAAPVPSFGVAMTGGVGGGGIAVPVGDVHAPKTEAPKRVSEEKTLAPREAPKAQQAQACSEPASKPKPLDLARPDYTEEARAAGVEGKVRIELTVDARGAVKSVRVLESLGHGLDEAATRAVQAATFEPALACGVPVEATFVVSIRFTL